MNKQLLSMFFYVLLFSIVHAQLPDSLIKKVDVIFNEYDKTNSPGCALAILKDGKIIYKRGYGISNLEYGIAISPSSLFHVASVSKQFTAAAIIRLFLEGKLLLNDDIRKYISEVPDFGHTITLNHLLHHTSGLRDVSLRYAGWREDDVVTENDILEMLKREKELNFLPGEEYSYSNTGYILLSIAVKRITGISLREYADSVFFKPLGMNSTFFRSNHSEIVPNRTSAYAKNDNGDWKISIPDFDYYGSTSLFTTVEDLSKWDENFYSKKIGNDDFINAMQLTGVLNDHTLQTYASGLILQTYKGYKTVEHSGVDAGYRANLLRFPDQHFSVIILANLANISPILLSYKVADLFLKDMTPKTQRPDIKTDSNIVKGWTGDYFDFNANATAKLNYSNGKLFSGDILLQPTSNFSYSVSDSTAGYSFSKDPANAKFALYIKGSKTSIYEKVTVITLAPAQLQPYAGDFFSLELDTKYKLFVKDNALFVKWPRYDEIKLTPFIKDIFTGSFIIVNNRIVNITVVYKRDKKNNITGFSLNTGRIRNLYFEKAQ